MLKPQFDAPYAIMLKINFHHYLPTNTMANVSILFTHLEILRVPRSVPSRKNRNRIRPLKTHIWIRPLKKKPDPDPT